MSGLAPDKAQEALRKSARGDVSAFEEIVRGNQAMVFSLAYHFMRDPSLAEELAQEVFLDLYQNLSAIKSPAHLTHWLRRVTGHRCIDEARRQKARPQMSLDDAPEPVAPKTSQDPLLAEKLRQLVAALPPKRRMVMILRYQEELELHEIAEVMEMPINTVKSCLQRSLAILRGKLARCGGGVHV